MQAPFGWVRIWGSIRVDPPFQESGLALHWIGRAILQSIQETGLHLTRAFPEVVLVEEVVEALAQRLGNPQFLAPRRIDSRDDDNGVGLEHEKHHAG